MGSADTAPASAVDQPGMRPDPAGPEAAAPVERTRRKRRRRPGLGLCLAMFWLVLIVLLAIFADVLPISSYGTPAGHARLNPGVELKEPLGTDNFGRSELSRVIYGARASLAVGFLSTLLGLLIGGTIGTAAGYFRGRLDRALGLLIDSMLAFPPLVLLLGLAAVLTPSVPMLVVSIGVVTIPSFARLARANAIRFSARDFVTAARLMGAGHRRILTREVIPNSILPVASYAFLVVATVIVVEGALSFLGLGVPPPQPSWGGMIAAGQKELATDPYLVFVPAAAMFLTVLSLSVLGDSARRRFDPHGGPVT